MHDGSLRRLHICGLHGVDDRLVSRDRRGHIGVGSIGDLEQARDSARDGLPGSEETLVASRRDDVPVEGDVGLHDVGVASTANGHRHLVDQVLQAIQVARVGALDREADGACLNHLADVVDLVDIRGAHADDRGTTARLTADETFVLEPCERLPDRDAADGEFLGKHFFPQANARSQLARDDRSAQSSGDDLPKIGTPGGSGSERLQHQVGR